MTSKIYGTKIEIESDRYANKVIFERPTSYGFRRTTHTDPTYSSLTRLSRVLAGFTIQINQCSVWFYCPPA